MSASAAPTFSYEEMTTRNIGFVTDAEQARLRAARVLITGVGGMGGAAAAVLVRAGVGALVLADIDVFEVSNLNRQPFCTLDTIGQQKVDATRDAIARINPHCHVDVRGGEWVDELPRLLADVDVVVNGCDDVRATLALMRAARGRRAVIDAFASTLPNVYTVGPRDPRPERVFGFPSVGRALESLSAVDVSACARREIEWVMAASSTAEHVVMSHALEVLAGKRARFSFAPMVWMTGCLMAYEVVRVVLGRNGGPGPRGVFFNPWAQRTERMAPGLRGAARRALVRSTLSRLGGAG